MNFERPLNAASYKSKRAERGMVYYNKFSKGVGNIMATNTYRKGQAVKLSANFNSSEFDCHGSGCCSETIINPQLVKYLQQIRDHFKYLNDNFVNNLSESTKFNFSKWMSALLEASNSTGNVINWNNNSRVGGAPGSRHSKGDAADIVVKGRTPREVAKYAESIGIKGIGLYETSADGYFVHIDTRSTKSFWYGQNE